MNLPASPRQVNDALSAKQLRLALAVPRLRPALYGSAVEYQVSAAIRRDGVMARELEEQADHLVSGRPDWTFNWSEHLAVEHPDHSRQQYIDLTTDPGVPAHQTRYGHAAAMLVYRRPDAQHVLMLFESARDLTETGAISPDNQRALTSHNRVWERELRQARAEFVAAESERLLHLGFSAHEARDFALWGAELAGSETPPDRHQKELDRQLPFGL